MPKETTQEIEVEQAAEAETNKKSYDQHGWDGVSPLTYTGEGYGFDAFYESISNNEFGAQIAVNNMVIAKPYLPVSGSDAIGNIVDKYNTGNFTQDGSIECPSYSEALEKLAEINKYLSEAGYFYDVYNGMPAKMESIQSELSELGNSIKNMSSDPLNRAGDSYNDDLEIAKNMQYNRYLEGIADTYNNSGKSRKKIADTISSYTEVENTVDNGDGTTTTTTEQIPYYDFVNNNYGYFKDDGTGWEENKYALYKEELEDKDIEPGKEIPASDGRKVIVHYSEYDNIDYYFGFKEFNGIIDSLFYTKDKLEKQLLSRKSAGYGCDFTKLEDRDSWSIYN